MTDRTVTTHIELEDLGIEVEVEAEFDYQPREAPEGPGYNHLGYPGCPASIEGIYEIKCIEKDEKLVKLFDKEMLNKNFAEIVEEQLEEAIWTNDN